MILKYCDLREPFKKEFQYSVGQLRDLYDTRTGATVTGKAANASAQIELEIRHDIRISEISAVMHMFMEAWLRDGDLDAAEKHRSA